MFSPSDFWNLVSTAYVLAFVAVATLILWFVRPWRWKLGALVVLVAAFVYPLVTHYLEEEARQKRNREIGARFQKLCKERAGDRIVRRVEGVAGIYLIRPRKPVRLDREYLDQYWMGDPYGHSNLEAKEPGHTFLSDRIRANENILSIVGFEFVEMPNPELEANPSAPKYLRIDAARRFTDKEGRKIIEYEKTVSDTLKSRYGVDWEDISTLEDRKIWIAGGRMRVVDLQTKEVLAERTGYVIDPEQGRQRGGGISWLIAQRTACPRFENESGKTKEFVARVLTSSRSK